MCAVPRVAIRVDASAIMGTGHLKRCLSLAQALAEAGGETLFICRSLDTVSAHLLATARVSVRWLPVASGFFTAEPDATPHGSWAGVPQTQDVNDTAQALANWQPDWLVVDHYAFDARWHRSMRDALGCRILVIDDIADRSLDADALLDHNWVADHRAKYAGRLLREPLWLCGPTFALLSSAYRETVRYAVHEKVRSIGIFMGGTDPDGLSTYVLAACRSAGFFGPVEVVSTSINPHLPALRDACAADGQTTLTLDAQDLADFFARHDLQVGAGGGATWERCCIGVPTIALALASNQDCVLHGVEQQGAIVWCRNIQDLPGRIRDMSANGMLRDLMHLQCIRLIDGRGTERVARLLIGSAFNGPD